PRSPPFPSSTLFRSGLFRGGGPGRGYNAAMVEPRSPLSSLKPLAGRALERALGRALELDPDTRAALGPLDGRRLVLRLDSPPLRSEEHTSELQSREN